MMLKPLLEVLENGSGRFIEVFCIQKLWFETTAISSEAVSYNCIKAKE
jgi:hypothetical protein